MKKRIVVIALIVIAASLLIWRLWPYSCARVMPLDDTSAIHLTAFVIVGGIKDGQANNDIYRLEIPSSETATLEDILEMLNASAYRQDYRNLLPRGVDSVDSGGSNDKKSVSLYFDWGTEGDQSVNIHFLSSRVVSVSSSEADGLRIYHPTNRELLYDLAEYVQTHGEKQ